MGAPAQSWQPEHLKQVLKWHAEEGARFHEPGWHSGYNELILNSRSINAQLPHSIAAFFTPKWQGTVSSTGTARFDIVKVHRDFVAHFLAADPHLREASLPPLVVFDPHDWEAPFELYDPIRGNAPPAKELGHTAGLPGA